MPEHCNTCAPLKLANGPIHVPRQPRDCPASCTLYRLAACHLLFLHRSTGGPLFCVIAGQLNRHEAQIFSVRRSVTQASSQSGPAVKHTWAKRDPIYSWIWDTKKQGLLHSAIHWLSHRIALNIVPWWSISMILAWLCGPYGEWRMQGSDWIPQWRTCPRTMLLVYPSAFDGFLFFSLFFCLSSS